MIVCHNGICSPILVLQVDHIPIGGTQLACLNQPTHQPCSFFHILPSKSILCSLVTATFVMPYFSATTAIVRNCSACGISTYICGTNGVNLHPSYSWHSCVRLQKGYLVGSHIADKSSLNNRLRQVTVWHSPPYLSQSGLLPHHFLYRNQFL